MHITGDLKVCYNCYLPKIGSIGEEPFGVQREHIRLLVKLLKIMQYYLCISHRIVLESHRGEYCLFRGAG